MIRGQTLVNYNGIEVALLPFPRLLVSQEMYAVGTPNGSHTGYKAMDFSGNSFKSYDLFAPFACKVVENNNEPSHRVTYESLTDVECADGYIGHVIFTLAHDSDVSNLTVGKTFKQGEAIYQYGGYGTVNGVASATAYPNHIHIEAAKGSYVKPAYIKNENGRLALRGEANPADVFCVNGTVITTPGLSTWKTYTGKTWADKLAEDAAKAQAELDRLAKLEAERLAKLEAERQAMLAEQARKDAEAIAMQEAAAAQAAKEAAEIQALKDKNYYITQRGDTLQAIAIKKNVSWKSLYETNRQLIGPNPLILPIGIKLLIPSGVLGQIVTSIHVGDEVYWEGHLYRDSFGAGETKASFPRTKGIIDIFNKNKFPVHIRGKGWVSITQIKKI